MSKEERGAEGFGELDHVGIAVADLEEALSFWRDIAGLELLERKVHLGYDVEIAFLSAGSTRIELIRGLTPRSVISRFVSKRGPGIHHLTFWVDDLAATMGRLEASGVPFLDEKPRRGAGGHPIAFLRPEGAHGVLVELAERPDAGA